MKKSLNLFIIISLMLSFNIFNNESLLAKEKKSSKTNIVKNKDNKNTSVQQCNEAECDDDCDEEIEDECDDEYYEEDSEIDDGEDEADECEGEECAIKGLFIKSKDKKPEKGKKETEEKGIDVKNYDLIFDEMLNEGIYPSFILFAQMNKELSETPLIHFYIEDKNAHVKVTVDENQFMEQCISEHDMNDKDDQIYSPWIKWKREALLNADKPGFINFSAVLEVNGVVKNRVNKTITYRSVNEAVLGMMDDKDEYTDFSSLFSCYVNEDHPRIDKILNEIIDKDKKARKITFYGYQGDSDKDVLQQMEWIWNYFANKGTRYSDITGSSNASEKFFAQYVRFFEQVIDNNQANCIDGTCMLASFYKRIGLDVSIILVPGHAFLAVSGLETNKKGEPKNTYYLETTLMGSKDMTFKDALKEAKREFKEAPEKETYVVNINACRAAGIMPLGR